MSNVLAAIGRGQLRVLEDRVRRKREIFEYYHQALGDLPGIAFMPEAPWGLYTRWLTVITIEPDEFGASRKDVHPGLEAENCPPDPPTLGGNRIPERVTPPGLGAGGPNWGRKETCRNDAGGVGDSGEMRMEGAF